MIPLPAYVDPDAWEGFVAMRKASGRTRPFTVRAATLILFELQRLKDAGHDPNACLDQSTRLGWADVYPLKDKSVARTSNVGTGELQRMRERDNVGPTPETVSKVRQIADAIKRRMQA